jgi:uncharacterized membrane protein
MEETFKQIAGTIALGVEAAAVLLIAIGAAEGIVLTLTRLVSSGARKIVHRKEIWIRFAVWLLLGLEFELGADVIRSAIAPSWNEIGQLGAIAAIRTGLNYFLEQDIAEYTEHQEVAA